MEKKRGTIEKTCKSCGISYQGYENAKWHGCSNICVQRLRREVGAHQSASERNYWYRRKLLRQYLETIEEEVNSREFLVLFALEVARGYAFSASFKKAREKWEAHYGSK